MADANPFTGGPFVDNEDDLYLRQLWDRRLYRFLRNFFRYIEMDGSAAPDERGLTLIKKTNDGRGWAIPLVAGESSEESYMFGVTANAKTDESGEQILDGGNPVWIVTVNGGTAQPLFGQIQAIPAYTNDPAGVAIASGSPLLVYLTYVIYDTGTSAYVHEFNEEIYVSATIPTDSWHTKYYALATVDSDGTVLIGHKGAVYLPSPKSVVDVDPEVEA